MMISVPTFRPATAADCPAIGRIQVACWRERLSAWAPTWFVENFNATQQAQKYAQRLADPAFLVWVVEEEGAIIGFAAAKPNDSPPEYPYQVSALYVDPNHEHKGVARGLMNAVLNALRQRNIPRVMLWTFAANAPARAVYEKAGGKLLPYADASKAADIDLDIPHVSYGWKLL